MFVDMFYSHNKQEGMYVHVLKWCKVNPPPPPSPNVVDSSGILHMRVPIKTAGSWGYFTESWKEPTPFLLFSHFDDDKGKTK